MRVLTYGIMKLDVLLILREIGGGGEGAGCRVGR